MNTKHTLILPVTAAFAAALIAGCASQTEPARLSARTADPDGMLSGLPARGETVCLAAASEERSSLELAVRRALADRGYRVSFLAPEEEPNPKRCRFFVTMTASRMSNPSDLPSEITLDYRDLYNGETQRANWRRDSRAAEARAAVKSGNDVVKSFESPLLTPGYADFELTVRNLVDQLFPQTR